MCWRPFNSTEASQRQDKPRFWEQNLWPVLPTGATFVSGQQSRERRPCVLGAGGVDPVMATAQPPAGGPRALPGL